VAPPPATEALDYELEVAAVIGNDCSDVSATEAWDCVAGLTIMNDWSARDLQRQEMAVGLGPAKGKDFATSLGPYLTTLDELDDRLRGDRHDLSMIARVNGRELSSGNLAALYWTFPQMIEHASRGTVLRCGDVIGSGTVGTGCILELGPENTGGWLQPGDVVELEVQRLGVLRNRVGGRATDSGRPPRI
jgi:fumarylacetoacetate (FAA) hydrolase